MTRATKEGAPKQRSKWRRTLVVVFWILLITLLVRGFIIDSYRVRSDSMMPLILTGDTVVASKLSYAVKLPWTHVDVVRHGSPKRGDIVVFFDPRGSGEVYVKRVIGLPGDEIELDVQRVLVNGREIARRLIEPYNYIDRYDRRWRANLFEETNSDGVTYRVLYDVVDTARWAVKCFYCNKKFKIQGNRLFVMGDNRDASTDSRHFGTVPMAYVVGEPLFVLFSASDREVRFDRIGKGL